MTWKNIRLDLARTAEFPDGSTAHNYIFSLPVDDNGALEVNELRDADDHPKVRRIWPQEPDRIGVILPKGHGWVFSYREGDADDEAIFHLENHPIKLGQYLTITETNGEKLPFRVTSCQE
ncbi:MAG: hypothetical protein ABI668_12655 [Sphingorhabdus sp.]